jgi:hypothetical protein
MLKSRSSTRTRRKREKGRKRRTLELDWSDFFHRHDWLKYNRFRLKKGLPKRANSNQSERELRRINGAKRAILQYHAHARDRVPRQGALLQRLIESLLDCRNVIAWHVPTYDDALESSILPRFPHPSPLVRCVL